MLSIVIFTCYGKITGKNVTFTNILVTFYYKKSFANTGLQYYQTDLVKASLTLNYATISIVMSYDMNNRHVGADTLLWLMNPVLLLLVD